MIFTKLLFIILIIVCAAFYILYVWDFALVLLVLIIALPIIMYITTFLAKRKMKVEFALQNKIVPKNSPFPVQICITNKSIFPIGKAEAHIEYYNVFNNKTSDFELYLPIQSRNTQRVTFRLKSKFCGIVKVKIAYISIYDPLRIFKFKIGKNVGAEIAVMPTAHDISGTVLYSNRINEDSSVFSESSPGDDPSEVFDLRDYVAGDKLNRIHWKLSSKKDDFIVKEYSLPIDVPCTVFLDLKCYEDSDYTLPVFDTLVETAVSLSQFLIENERVHSLIFYHAKHKRFVQYTISDAVSLADAVRDLLLSINDNLFCEPPETYFAQNSCISVSSFTLISSTDCDSPVIEYIDSNIDADIRNAVMIVKNSAEIGTFRNGYSSVNITPVLIGRISASIKDIEI